MLNEYHHYIVNIYFLLFRINIITTWKTLGRGLHPSYHSPRFTSLCSTATTVYLYMALYIFRFSTRQRNDTASFSLSRGVYVNYISMVHD